MSTKPNSARTSLIDTYIKAVKGVYSKLDADYLIASHAADAAVINIVAPGDFDLTVTGTLTFTEDLGYTGDGSTGYLDTGFNPTTAGGNYTQDSASVAAWITDHPAPTTASATDFSIGALTDSIVRIAPLASATTSQVRLNGTSTGVPVLDTADQSMIGDRVVVRSASTAIRTYAAGTKQGTDSTNSSTGLPNSNLALLHATTVFSAGTVGASFFGGALTDAEVLTLYNAKLAFLQAIGAA